MIAERSIKRLQATPFGRAIESPVIVLFVPYANASKFRKGRTIHACLLSIIFCGKVGEVGDAVSGEVRAVHPFFGKPVRGYFVNVRLDQPKRPSMTCCMLVERPYSFRGGAARAAGVAAISLILSACSAAPSLVAPQAAHAPAQSAKFATPLAGWLATSHKKSKAPGKAPKATAPSVQPVHVAAKPLKSGPPDFGPGDPKRSTLGGLARVEPGQSASAWCEYLRRDAAATATILRSPTVAGEINDTGDKAIAVDLDVMDLAKAHLVEKAARARCRRYQANFSLKEQAIAQPHRLTRAASAPKPI